ncbi:MAG: translation initiation factor eIF-2B [Deltaproteobacteria bacterium]|nr:MAG: translation initiation factor eIF-2B [Deltaproteobacteria bacterium]
MKWPSSVEGVLREIRSDNLSGATQLAERGARLLLWYLKRETKGDLQEGIKLLGKALVDAQPAMAPMLNLVNSLFLTIEALEDPLKIKREGIKTIEEFLDALAEGTEKIRDYALPLLEGKKTILTHSYSSTVLRVLGNARGAEVICPEGRPLYEGLKTAKELAKRGIKVKLMVDFAAISRVNECNLVMVGADSVTPDGVVNKIGTYGIALVAKDNNIPLYVLTGKEKFLPWSFYQALRIEKKDPREVTQENIPNVAVENFYFDLTPLRLITGVVTQEGIIPAEGVLEALKKVKISRWLTEP